MDSDWYRIYTKPWQENVAEENLQRQGYSTYLPFIQVNKRRLGRYQLVTETLFPRYLFILLNILNIHEDNWSPIRSTRGVFFLVCFGGIPAKVPLEFIQFLKSNENAVTTTSKVSLFQKGQRV